MNRTQIQSQLIEKSLRDATFRQRLVQDPRATIAEFCQVDLPDDLAITVVEETPERLCLVLPPAPAAEEELSDADLAGIAGGRLLSPARRKD